MIKKVGPKEYVVETFIPRKQKEKLKEIDIPEIKGVKLRKSKLTPEEVDKIIEDLKKGTNP